MKKIGVGIFVVILVCVAAAIYVFNKPRPSAANIKGIAITAVDLNKEYNADEKKANATYLDKVLEVTGAVSDISKNQDGGMVINLDTGDPLMGVQCTMKDTTAKVSKGQTITLKGFCKGNNLGVVLNDCVIK